MGTDRFTAFSDDVPAEDGVYEDPQFSGGGLINSRENISFDSPSIAYHVSQGTKMELSVPQCIVVYPRLPEVEYVVFRILIKVGAMTFTSDHRYSTVRAFHRTFLALGCNAACPCRKQVGRLPSRLFTSRANHSLASIDKRRAGLDAYLRSFNGKRLCSNHSQLLHSFLDASLNAVLGSTVEESNHSLSSRPKLCDSKSLWAVPVSAKYAPWCGVSLQFFDSCKCNVVRCDGQYILNITRYGSLLDADPNISRARVQAIGKMFSECFSGDSFPSTSIIERWLHHYRTPLLGNTRRNRWRESRSGVRSSSHHPLYWLMVDSNAPKCLLQLAQHVWDMNDPDIVTISDDLLLEPGVCRLMRNKYRSLCDGEPVARRVAQEMCREVLACFGAGRCAECAKGDAEADFSGVTKTCCMRAGSIRMQTRRHDTVSLMVEPPPSLGSSLPCSSDEGEAGEEGADTSTSLSTSNSLHSSSTPRFKIPADQCLSVDRDSPLVLVGGMSFAEASIEEIHEKLGGSIGSSNGLSGRGRAKRAPRQMETRRVGTRSVRRSY